MVILFEAAEAEAVADVEAEAVDAFRSPGDDPEACCGASPWTVGLADQVSTVPIDFLFPDRRGIPILRESSPLFVRSLGEHNPTTHKYGTFLLTRLKEASRRFDKYSQPTKEK